MLDDLSVVEHEDLVCVADGAQPVRNGQDGPVGCKALQGFLDHALESGSAPPSLVLVIMGTRTFALEADGFTLAQIPAPIGGWSGRIPFMGLPAVEAFQLVAARLFPLYAQHRSFEAGIRKGLWRIDGSRLPIGAGGTSVLPRAYPDGVAPFAEKVLGEFAAMGDGPIPSVRHRQAIRGLVRAAEQKLTIF